MKKVSDNAIKKVIIFELARVTDFDGIKTAFESVKIDYPENAADVDRIAAAVIRELKTRKA